MSEQETIRFKFPTLPTQRSNSPPPRARSTVKCPGYARGGILKFRIDRCIMFILLLWVPAVFTKPATHFRGEVKDRQQSPSVPASAINRSR